MYVTMMGDGVKKGEPTRGWTISTDRSANGRSFSTRKTDLENSAPPPYQEILRSRDVPPCRSVLSRLSSISALKGSALAIAIWHLGGTQGSGSF
jgi:hypothetical protein